MKSTLRKLLSAAAVLLLLSSLPALAEEERVIAVQLDGETLVFPDAVPQVRDQRTFLPFRAVFEAMGAEVSYADNVVTAVRGDRTVIMTIGDTAAAVTIDGAEEPLTMDVAPYVDPATWRTYVPVRFAANALGCAVGWDQEAYTVLIADTEKLLRQEMEGLHFTLLDKLAAYAQRYNEGIWDMDVTAAGTLSNREGSTPLSVTATGITQGRTKAQMDASLTLGELALEVSLRGDLEEGRVYLNGRGEAVRALLGSAVGMAVSPDRLWLGVDVNAVPGVKPSGRTAAGEDYYRAIASWIMGVVYLNSASEGGYGDNYADYLRFLKATALALSDEGALREGEVCSFVLDCGLRKLQLDLTLKEDGVASCALVLFDTTGDTYTTLSAAVDEENNFSGHLDMETRSALSLDFSGSCTPGETAPATAPGFGAVVVDLGEGGALKGLPFGSGGN